jgi:hypothetical protein
MRPIIGALARSKPSGLRAAVPGIASNRGGVFAAAWSMARSGEMPGPCRSLAQPFSWLYAALVAGLSTAAPPDTLAHHQAPRFAPQ